MVEEIPVQAPWSFGPIPPGELRAPSYQESVQIAVDWARDWLIEHPNRTFMLGGYSQGGEAASRVYAETLPGGPLEDLRGNYVGGFAFGNPSRHLEHTFWEGPLTDGEGIAAFRLGAMGWDWCELVHTDDMYAGVPARLTGEIMRDVYQLCTELQVHDMRQFTVDLIANCLEVVQNLDGDAFDDMTRGLFRHHVDLGNAQILSREKLQPLTDKLLSVRGISAAIEACVLGLQFLCWQPPTAPHISYSVWEVWPGMTYLQLAIKHTRDYAGRRIPTR